MSKFSKHEVVTHETYLVVYRVAISSPTRLRLDHFLMEHYRKRSRGSIQYAIEQGRVRIERKQSPHLQVGVAKASTLLLDGDTVFVQTERHPEPEVNFNYKILYEDDFLFVVEKPPMLPVHPSGRYYFNTLLTHLKTKGFTLPLEAEESYYLAHRIDKETSGILVLTKDPESCAKIVSQFSSRTTEKRYLAVVYGHPPATFESHEPMGRSATSKIRLKMEIKPEADGGQAASTKFRCIAKGTAPSLALPKHPFSISLIECFPKTGRQHQIRLHLESLGYPIVGDKLYGQDEEFALLFYERDRLTPEAEARLLLPRHALHSSYLKIVHPQTGEPMEFQSPLPEDLQLFLTKNNVNI